MPHERIPGSNLRVSIAEMPGTWRTELRNELFLWLESDSPEDPDADDRAVIIVHVREPREFRAAVATGDLEVLEQVVVNEFILPTSQALSRKQWSETGRGSIMVAGQPAETVTWDVTFAERYPPDPFIDLIDQQYDFKDEDEEPADDHADDDVSADAESFDDDRAESPDESDSRFRYGKSYGFALVVAGHVVIVIAHLVPVRVENYEDSEELSLIACPDDAELAIASQNLSVQLKLWLDAISII